MTIVMACGDGLVAFRSPCGVRRKDLRRRHTLWGRLLQGGLQEGSMGPSTSGDLKTTGSEVSPTHFAIVRGEMKDVGLSLFFCRLAKNSIEKKEVVRNS